MSPFSTPSSSSCSSDPFFFFEPHSDMIYNTPVFGVLRLQEPEQTQVGADRYCPTARLLSSSSTSSLSHKTTVRSRCHRVGGGWIVAFDSHHPHPAEENVPCAIGGGSCLTGRHAARALLCGFVWRFCCPLWSLNSKRADLGRNGIKLNNAASDVRRFNSPRLSLGRIDSRKVSPGVHHERDAVHLIVICDVKPLPICECLHATATVWIPTR